MSWICHHCGNENSDIEERCSACGKYRYKVLPKMVVGSQVFTISKSTKDIQFGKKVLKELKISNEQIRIFFSNKKNSWFIVNLSKHFDVEINGKILKRADSNRIGVGGKYNLGNEEKEYVIKCNNYEWKIIMEEK